MVFERGVGLIPGHVELDDLPELSEAIVGERP
jgi:hypothetical protein